MEIDQLGLIKPFGGQIEVIGTSFQGYIEVSFTELRRLFGKPTDGDAYKNDAHWIVKTPSGTATIYNYKDGRNYLGREGTPKTKIKEWNIGGYSINDYAWACFAILRN